MERVDRLLQAAEADLGDGLITTAWDHCQAALRRLAALDQHNRDSRERYEHYRDIMYRTTTTT